MFIKCWILGFFEGKVRRFGRLVFLHIFFAWGDGDGKSKKEGESGGVVDRKYCEIMYFLIIL